MCFNERVTPSKKCSTCKQVLPLGVFYKNASRRDGLSAHCRPCIKAHRKTYREKEPEKASARYLSWARRNPGKRCASVRAYQAAKLQRVPPWADLDAISDFYQGCPEGHQVDHIIPLRGVTVSGLHVLSNLQYLSASENASKCNSF